MLLLVLALACNHEEPADPVADGGTAPATTGDGSTDTTEVDGTGDDGGSTTTDTGDTEEDPSDYTYDEDEIELALTATDVELALAEGLATFFDLDLFLAFDALQDSVADGDGDCPVYYDYYKTTYGYDYWYGPCSTRDDIDYDGYIYGVDYGEYDTGSYHYNRYGWWYGDFRANYPDGSVYEQTGYLYGYDYTYTPSNYRYFYSYLIGESIWTSPEWEGTWLTDSLSLSLYVTGASYSGAGRYLDLEGGISGFSGDISAIDFSDVWIANEDYSSCPEEPSGQIGVRGPDGEWYQVLFHGPAYEGAESFPLECDGCGEVWVRGQMIGMACPDFSALTDWEGSPWD